MTTFRFGRTQKALTLVPLAAASAVWTASLVGVGATSATADEQSQQGGALPDGSTVPTEAIEAPASVTSNLGPNSGGLVQSASTTGIPSPALTAYQRAETIINSADKDCNLPWQLVAAIGRVESDHGRFGGNSLDANGVARPGIYGIALNGKNSTQKIADTDAGQYDQDQVYDRAVGPMQFIPSTWQVVGVDADSDGERNPQDIDDAALATAVYLCSGKDDLSTVAGQEASVFRYNHSREYVDLVLSIMNAYMDGDYMTVPAGTTSAGYIVPNPDYVAPGRGVKPPRLGGGSGSGAGTGGGSGSTGGGTSGGDGGDDGTTTVPTEAPSSPLPENPLPSVKLPSPSEILPSEPVKSATSAITDTLTKAEASAQCLAQVGVSSVTQLSLTQLATYNDCMARKGF